MSPADKPARVAQLAFAAGRIAEKLGDVGGAIERYEAALEAEPTHAHALRGLRRLRLADGKREPVLGMLDREIAEASSRERRGLHAIRAELALALGDRDVGARLLRGDPRRSSRDDLGALSGLVDLAASSGDDGRAQALGKLYEALGSADAPLRAALLVERARLDEAAGRVREAVAHYREALGRAAIRRRWRRRGACCASRCARPASPTTSRPTRGSPSCCRRERCARRSSGGSASLRARGGDVAGARPALQAAAADGDRVALADLGRSSSAPTAASKRRAPALARVVEAEPDAGRRADRLSRSASCTEKQGRIGDAAAAYARAADEYPDDPRAARALERTQAAGGDKESALQRHLQAAERSPARAPMELTYAARLLRELGRADEALARLDMALTAAPTLAPAHRSRRRAAAGRRARRRGGRRARRAPPMP